MARLIAALVLALASSTVYAQTPTPTLDTNTGAGAVPSTATASRSVISLTSSATGRPRTSTTSGVTAFTGPLTYPIVSRFPVLVTHSGVVYISTATITLTPSHQPNVQSASHSSTNKGAIAGGVIGALAILIAAIATFLCLRRRSPNYWKARTARRWKDLGGKPPLLPTATQGGDLASAEDKAAAPEFSRPTTNKEDPFKDPVIHEVEALPPALYIREHRQPIQDPFADPPESPSGARPTHKRNTSSVNPLLPPTA